MKFAIFDSHCVREMQIPTMRRPHAGDLRKCEEKAPCFSAGMNPTTPTPTTVRWHGRIFHAPIHAFK